MYNSPKYIYSGDGMGYVFLDDNNVNVARELRKGNNTFLNISIDNTNTEGDSDYAYAILPNTNYQEINEYSKNPDFEILSQTDDMHAVKDLSTGTVLANVFNPSVLEDITVSTPCSIMYTQENGVYNFVVCDPTKTQDAILLKFNSNVQVIDGQNVSACGNIVTVNISSDRSKMVSFSIKTI